MAVCAFAKHLLLRQALNRYCPCGDLYMQNGDPQNHMTAFEYQIFGFVVNGQEHTVETNIVRAQGLC